MNTACMRCRKPIAWPESFCSRECRHLGAAPTPAPISVPHTQMHARPGAPTRRAQIPGRALLEADRRKAAPGPTPKERAEAALRHGRAAMAVPPPKGGTITIREARETLAALSAQDSERLNSERENDMHIRAAGLVPHHPELEQRRSTTKAGKLRDLTG
jgi:hypothetical protein